ncbi:hypothetical protein DFH09DRAFT_1448236 [Mycena vulgaris]|nr:hypothetical protein DFH09DRAFT_1448236 [Mycena vulgaris]
MDFFTEEILSEILALLLKVSDEMFSDIVSRYSPFAFSETNPSVLLVSKSWRRVATPLLYSTVAIRSKEQAQALDATLRKNKDLGWLIKKLRVEGGFGTPMHNILKCSPNISDLYLSLQVGSPDTVAGLVLGLPLINPTRLILFDVLLHTRKNKSVTRLVKALEESSTGWDNLSAVVLPGAMDLEKQSLAVALCSKVKSVSVPLPGEGHIPKYFREIAQVPSLQALIIRADTEESYMRFLEKVPDWPRFKSLAIWSDSSRTSRVNRARASIRPLDPSFRPMSSTPTAIADFVWGRILSFAMIRDQLPDPRTLLLRHAAFNFDRLRFLLVSKQFTRLALPYLYGYPVFPFDAAPFQRFAQKLAQDPSLRIHVRAIQTFMQTPHLTRRVLSCATGLTSLIGYGKSSMNWDTFEALAETAGPTLVEFRGYHVSEPASPLYSAWVFTNLTALRSLDWNADIKFYNRECDIPVSGLSTLTSLELHGSLLVHVVCQMELPKLRNLVLRCTPADCLEILRAHGHKLTEMTTKYIMIKGHSLFDLCPSISALTLELQTNPNTYLFDTPPEEHFLDAAAFKYPSKYPSLRQLSIDKPDRRSKPEDAQEWKKFFSTINLSHFPELRAIHLLSVFWPTVTMLNEPVKDPWWSTLAKALLEHDVKLVDMMGANWRSRLKIARQ